MMCAQTSAMKSTSLSELDESLLSDGLEDEEVEPQ